MSRKSESDVLVGGSEPKKAKLNDDTNSDGEDLDEEEDVESKCGDEEPNCGIREFVNSQIKRFQGALKKRCANRIEQKNSTIYY